MRVALAVDSYIFFANIRPDYRWGFFGDTLVCAYTQADRSDQVRPCHVATPCHVEPVPVCMQALDFTRKGHPEAHLMTQFWGSHQRFFRALCMSLKVPELVEI